MRFWDSSALVTLHVRQAGTARMRGLYSQDSNVLAWMLSDVEMCSALRRLEREGAMDRRRAREAISRIEAFWETVNVVVLTDAVKARAKTLLAVHPLRAADSLQLAAALAAFSHDPAGREFVCLDSRLSEAAEREGFTIVPGAV